MSLMQIESHPRSTQLSGHLDEMLDRVERTGGVTDGPLRMLAGTFDGRNRRVTLRTSFRASNTRNTSIPFGRGALDESIDDRVFVVAVAEQILPSQQHLEPRIGHQATESPQPLPGILVQKADARVERGAAPALDRPESGAVEVLARGHHVFERHARGHEALVGIAENQLGEVDGLLGHEG